MRSLSFPLKKNPACLITRPGSGLVGLFVRAFLKQRVMTDTSSSVLRTGAIDCLPWFVDVVTRHRARSHTEIVAEISQSRELVK